MGVVDRYDVGLGDLGDFLKMNLGCFTALGQHSALEGFGILRSPYGITLRRK